MQQQINNMANSTQQSQQMVEQMTALASTVSTLKAQLENSSKNQDRGRNGRNHGRDRTNDRDSNRRGRGSRGGGRGPSKGPFKYCYTHGNCAHSGANCKTPTDDYIKDATYSNMQGGSTNRCHWLCPYGSVLNFTKHIQLVDQNTRVSPSSNLANHTAIADTGATGHYLDTAAEPHCTGI
jgi:hypothetical protein